MAKATIDGFKDITRYDLESYLTVFNDFVSTKVPLLMNYFSGGTNVVPSQSIKFLRKLIIESQKIEYLVGQNSSQFVTTDYWDLLETLDDIRVRLETLNNLPKWARVSVTTNKNSDLLETEISLHQNQSIENALALNMGYTDEHNQWYDVAIRNDVEEEDYTPENGKLLKVPVQAGVININTNSVVDLIDFETLKGKDLYKKLTWESDDLKTISGTECFLQTVDILLKMYKGDNTEFIEQGLSKNIAVGSNINGVSYPILTRQLSEQFSTDDTISSFKITNISRDQDAVYLDFEIKSKAGELFNISQSF